MLNIHTGRENLDKDAFMFAKIKERLGRGKRVILIVPDQYTLQAEKNAFAYMEVPALMDLEVLSFSRLAGRVFAEVGGGRRTFVNNYGKYMMISRILFGENKNLKVFKDLEDSPEFVEKINNFISDMKNHNISISDIKKIAYGEDSDSLLARKLEDISRVYEEYEECMGDEQIDTADYLSLFISKIGRSELIGTCEFWLSGFDYLSPKNMDAVLKIAKKSGSMDVVLTAEEGNSFFASTNALADNLRSMALDEGLNSKIIKVPDSFEREHEGRDALVHLEKQYISKSPVIYEGPADDNIEFISAANFYSEAETAAAKISEFIRDKKMRYRDILVICNDMDSRASVIKRVFSEYGLPVFIDQRRGIHHNPALEYITALLDIASDGWRSDLIVKLAKTGLTALSGSEAEELENYAIKFKITYGKWKREFKLSGGDYSEEELASLNHSRDMVVSLISGFESGFKSEANVREKTQRLFEFLNEEAMLPAKIEEYRISLEEAGELEYAEEMSQVWSVILGIFDQLVDILGDEVLTDEEYATILKTGFESIQMGMLPPSIDQIILGTMQRTRTGKIKALFVLGANDGVLPAYSGEETLLNEDERDVLYNKGNIICRNDRQIMDEEQMAIYRNLAKPKDYLFMSYSVSDAEGGEIRPSIIFEKVRRILPSIQIKKDILNREDALLELVQGRGSTANHLTDAMRSWVRDDLMPSVWSKVFAWFDANEPGITRRIIDGLSFRNNRGRIDEKFITDLYKPSYDEEGSKIISSPSGLENFSRCPFSFFMSRGIRLKERRIYELDSRDAGDVYHETLMQFGSKMCDDGLKPLDPDSKWNKLSDEECRDVVSDIYDRVQDSYNDGLFRESKYEEYRGERFKKIITDTAIEIKNQVQAGSIDDMYFETRFAGSGEFDPIIVEKEGRTVEVTGKIDRLDVLEGGYAKIIDYKSGADSLAREDILSGWQLQLMVYMKAVTESRQRLKPAGVFYFRIPELHLEAGSMTEEQIREELKDEVSKRYQMDGMVINDIDVIETITGELDSKTSKIIAAKLPKDAEDSAAGKAVVDKSDFEAIENTVSSLITDLCEGILSGDVKAAPKESKKKKITACAYCEYRGICGYDKSFD